MTTLKRRRKGVRPAKSVLCIALSLGITLPAKAHVEIAVQVAELTRQIDADPGNAALYLRRGDLHRIHRNWSAALEDFQNASQLDPKLHAGLLLLGKMLLEAGLQAQALAALDRFLVTEPGSPEALFFRARAFARCGRRLEAAGELSLAISRFVSPRAPPPEYYLERARALAGGGSEGMLAALRGLDEGLERLGHPIALELCAVDLELAMRRPDAAIERLEKTARRSPRQETWLARKGEVLLEAGRFPEARRAFEDALAAIEKLPARCRSARNTTSLEASVSARLARFPEESNP